MLDVVIASDLRFPGGTSHSIAEEVLTQYRGGYRTGLVHLNGPLVGRLRPVNPLLRRQVEAGHAELLVSREPARTRLLVLRHPAVAQHALDQLPPIVADEVVVVANAGPRDIDDRTHYDPAAVDAAVLEHLGRLPRWAPIGPQVRAEITPQVPTERLLPDWVNIIDVDAWAAPRRGGDGRRPVVGRHSRSSPQKWPPDAATIRAVYPTDGSWDVRILGGAGPAEEVLGEQPAAWAVHAFGELDPKEFLAGLDFFVYYHDPRWVEAFGRTILEAVASGAVAVLPPHFEPLFGEAACYAEPGQVHRVVSELYADPVAYRAQAERASASVRSRFGHEAHRRRLVELIGPGAAVEQDGSAGPGRVAAPAPGVEPAEVAVDRPLVRAGSPSRRRVLLISSNGAGMGHLTRLLSYARRIEDGSEPYFLSLSQAVPVVSRLGFRYEYLPSSGALAMAPSAWQQLFVARVSECLDRVRPEVVVFDGTWPYNGIPLLRKAYPDVPWVWSRRGMWRHGANREQVRKAQWFEQVIEPGDLAGAYDRGATSTETASRVGPVTLLDREDLQSREQARAELGLPADRPLGLISLGAGAINDIRSDVGAVGAAMRALGLEVCLTRTEIGAGSTQTDVHAVRDYPLARRYAAFDVVVSAAGYNSFQELMRMGVPSLLVPNTRTALDDQQGRARFAADRGWAHAVERVETAQVQPLLADLLERGRQMAAGAVAADPGNGAAEAASLITSLARRGPS